MSSNNRYKLENNSDLETINSFKILISNIKALKDKTWGCPWQKIQSHISLIPFLYEESNEFIDAIYEKNADNMCEELGDLLLQVMLHAEISYEEKEFTLNDVIKNLNKKIINRHPYIFNKKEKVSLEKSQQIWENIKNSEKETIHIESSISKNLNLKIKNLPPTVGTDKITNVVKESHHAEIFSLPCDKSSPKLGVVDGTPRPRKSKLVRIRIAPLILKGKKVTTEIRLFGNICLIIIW